MELLVPLIVVAIVAWIIYSYVIPAMPAPVGQIVAIVVGLGIILYLLRLIGVDLF